MTGRMCKEHWAGVQVQISTINLSPLYLGLTSSKQKNLERDYLACITLPDIQ